MRDRKSPSTVPAEVSKKIKGLQKHGRSLDRLLESIVHEADPFFVEQKLSSYRVFKQGVCVSESIAEFTLDEDGRSLAIAYCDYRAKETEQKRRTWLDAIPNRLH